MIEQELKYLVSKNEFDVLLAYFKTASFRTVTYNMSNYYFDTPNFDLLRTGVSLRLRNRDGVWFCTYKCRIKGKLFVQRREGALINEEYEDCIDTDTAQAIVKGTQSFFTLPLEFLSQLKKDLDVSSDTWDTVRCFGGMHVTRTKTTIVPYAVPLECDHVVYDDGAEEFEIESETDNLMLAESVIGTLFRQNNIEIRPNATPKIIRFLSRNNPDPSVLAEWKDN